MEQREAGIRRKNREMAGRRVYGGSDMPALLHKEGITPHAALEALLDSSSASPHAGFDVSGSSSILNFQGARANAMNQQFYLPLEAEETGDDDADDVDASLRQPEKKRRLTTDKVQSLEKSFEVDNKLEPERKIQLAKDLGLQPRQVAIWFQNRRARWKTKQLEKDYEVLKSNYSALKMDHENLQKEKEKLKAEVIFLADKLPVKEKEEGTIEAAQWKNSESINSGVEAKESKTEMMGVKQELDLSSTNNSSTIFDSESSPPPPPPPPPPPRHCIDGGQNRLSTEAAASSSAEDEEVKGYHQWLKLEDNSNNFAFPVEDQAWWFWPNCYERDDI